MKQPQIKMISGLLGLGIFAATQSARSASGIDATASADQKTLATTPGIKTLVVEFGRLNVDLIGSDKTEVSYKVELKKGRVEDCLIIDTSSTSRISFSEKEKSLLGNTAASTNAPCEGSVSIVAPKTLALDLKTGSGFIRTVDFNADLEVASGSGSASIEKHLGNVTFKSGSGGLSGKLGGGKEILVTTASGGIDLELEDCDKLNINSSSGRVKVKGQNLNAKITSVSGNVEINTKALSGEVSSVSGDIKIEQKTSVLGKRLTLASTSGDLNLKTIEKLTPGNLEATNVSGNIKVTVQKGELLKTDLRSVSGNIRADQASLPQAPFSVAAKTVSGDIILKME